MHTFYVVEPDPVVRLDLVGLLETQFPESAVHVISDIAALDGLNADPTAILIIHGSVADGCEAHHLHGCVSLGVNIIFIGSPTVVSVPGTILDQPFTSSMVLDAIHGLATSPDPA